MKMELFCQMGEMLEPPEPPLDPQLTASAQSR